MTQRVIRIGRVVLFRGPGLIEPACEGDIDLSWYADALGAFLHVTAPACAGLAALVYASWSGNLIGTLLGTVALIYSVVAGGVLFGSAPANVARTMVAVTGTCVVATYLVARWLTLSS